MTFTNEGLLLSCNPDGTIRKVFYNNTHLKISYSGNQLLTSLFVPNSTVKILDFLMDVKTKSFSFGWEFIPSDNINHSSMHFSGALINNEITIFGSQTMLEFETFMNGMMIINNEQTNTIRELIKTEKSTIKEPEKSTTYYLEELSRLNNELVDTQRELSKKNMELSELNELKDQFLGMAAHDLRNPLGFILNYSEFLQEETFNFSEEQIDFVNQIKSLSEFMLNLVTDLLDISSIESGRINLKNEPTDLSAVIRATAQLNRALAEKKGITLDFQTEIDSLIISFDKGKIDQVTTNLITNAIKFSHPKTKITVSLTKNENSAVVAIKDQGQGIAKDELDLLFKPFKTTSVRTTGGEKSTGLGLFIVSRIINAHGGKIWVESSSGEGSVFSFSIPLE